MRFLHTSDWHLGRTLHGVDLLDAQRNVLDQICRLVAEPPDGVPVDAVLIAGDVYDRAVPPVEAVTLFESTLAQLVAHATVIVTAGNHDSAIRLGFGAQLFTERLRLRTELASVGTPVLLGGADSPVAVYPFPYLDPDAARTVLAPGDQPLERSHQAVLAAAMDRVRHDLASRPPGTRSVVMAHAFVVGGLASESERSIVVGGVDSVAAGTFDGVDYVALGHLHGAQQPRGSAGTVLRYSGSPLRYSFSELAHTKSVTLVDLEPESGVRASAVPLRQPRAMAELTGTLAELLADERHTEDWVRLVVTDRSRPDQLLERVRSRFPHVLQVQHLPAGARPAGASSAPLATPTASPRQLGADFVEHVTGLAALERELDLFEQAYQAAAVAGTRPGGG
ncbi:exonuclease SbcCD subunit D [Jatrophihabitans sp.]|uniref:exonuclease SbcCD subunit D n=1 Tax=Jatrophihabitans sp. TaxID=1932789 RepID=UPI002CD7462B|nr:exonuclease SbcCD subunit D [Jatrophihabitans sp.]